MVDFNSLAASVQSNPMLEPVLPYYFALRDFLFNIFSLALQGDPVAIIVLGIIAVILLIIIFQVAAWLFGLIKRVFLLLVVVISFYFFMTNYGSHLLAEGTSTSILIVGAIGLLFGVIAVISMIYSLHSHAKISRYPLKEEKEKIKIEELKAGVPFTPSKFRLPGMFSTQGFSTQNFFNAIKNDRSLMSVLSYIIIAEFGVFSGITVAAPSSIIGLGLFVVFLVASFIFIKTTYHNYQLGLIHLLIGLVFAVILSIILGHFWVNISLSQLLSWDYFSTTSLVAVITGLAISLFMGSRS